MPTALTKFSFQYQIHSVDYIALLLDQMFLKEKFIEKFGLFGITLEFIPLLIFDNQTTQLLQWSDNQFYGLTYACQELWKLYRDCWNEYLSLFNFTRLFKTFWEIWEKFSSYIFLMKHINVKIGLCWFYII